MTNVPHYFYLKEQLDLNSGTRSLILTILTGIYVPLAFVSSYFGMNASEITNGGLISTTTIWKVSIPLVIAILIVPVVFSGLRIRMTIKAVRSLYQKWLEWWRFFTAGAFIALNVASAVLGGHPLFWIVWALNMLYTLDFVLDFIQSVPNPLRVSRRLKDTNATREFIASRDSNSAIGFNATRYFNIARNSSETEGSWVTADSGMTHGSGLNDGPSTVTNPRNMKKIQKQDNTRYSFSNTFYSFSIFFINRFNYLLISFYFICIYQIHIKFKPYDVHISIQKERNQQ